MLFLEENSGDIIKFGKVVCFILVVFHGLNAINTDYTIRHVGLRCDLGEGPFWDEDKQLLYFVDMTKNVLNSYNPRTGRHVRATVETKLKMVTLVIRVQDTVDGFVITTKGGLYLVRWDGVTSGTLKPSFVSDVEDPRSGSRLNDGKADPVGRLWVGSMGALVAINPNQFEKNKGAIYLVDPWGRPRKEVSPMQLSNGLEWSLCGDKFYFVDSMTNKVYESDYNIETGGLKNVRTLFDCKKEGLVDAMNSLPDGMTIDTEGMLWVALYGTQKVIRINPRTGKLIFEITIEKCLQPTSVAFGGRDLDILYVTSAKQDWLPELEAVYPLSGYLFEIKGLGVRGFPSRYAYVAPCLWEDH